MGRANQQARRQHVMVGDAPGCSILEASPKRRGPFFEDNAVSVDSLSVEGSGHRGEGLNAR
jgi:hypothetical protein